MKTYYAECVVKYTYQEPNEEPYSDEEMYEYIFQEKSIKKARQTAKILAIDEFNNDFGIPFTKVKITDIYETLSDARL